MPAPAPADDPRQLEYWWVRDGATPMVVDLDPSPELSEAHLAASRLAPAGGQARTRASYRLGRAHARLLPCTVLGRERAAVTLVHAGALAVRPDWRDSSRHDLWSALARADAITVHRPWPDLPRLTAWIEAARALGVERVILGPRARLPLARATSPAEWSELAIDGPELSWRKGDPSAVRLVEAWLAVPSQHAARRDRPLAFAVADHGPFGLAGQYALYGVRVTGEPSPGARVTIVTRDGVSSGELVSGDPRRLVLASAVRGEPLAACGPELEPAVRDRLARFVAGSPR